MYPYKDVSYMGIGYNQIYIYRDLADIGIYKNYIISYIITLYSYYIVILKLIYPFIYLPKCY